MGAYYAYQITNDENKINYSTFNFWVKKNLKLLENKKGEKNGNKKFRNEKCKIQYKGIEEKLFEREKTEISFFLGTSAIKRWKHNKNMF